MITTLLFTDFALAILPEIIKSSTHDARMARRKERERMEGLPRFKKVKI